MSKTKARKLARVHGSLNRARKLAHDLKLARYDEGLHNRLGQGALPVRRPKPSITLPTVWRH